ncbi:ABC transporter ATP-binding protein [Pararhizobium antarcticum]|uniref:Spermidine/putrescine ABC transporter n=1 Tax=Pararhizobium antarcticum TaxID=1798805 RepID=A0A657LUH8_9HYPH|nr:ABC transporter ATP-binding protein [Pararhizobium antarcticum]OJF92613.1 spermidine/putrescine ABC transporter [Rhizobium sp. 58]OJF97752.1 spermidine/putrescine ABC transporter [Pararhizobium antarcticum]
MAISIQIDHVSREYGPVKALDDVSIDIKAGEFFTLLGSSGCGKSSLLKLIGGFDRQTSGRVCFDGKDVGDLPANQRPVNTVFQNLALFPHMSVAQNVGYGLRLKGLSGSRLQVKIDDALDLVELTGFGARDVNLLSGGQRQRVALARALVMEPGILLLDEPLTGLDERLRQQMRDEFGRLHKRTGATFILVTHNQDEALSLSDRMAVMHKGRIEQMDVPARFFETPANAFVARFVGIDTLLHPQAVLVSGNHGAATIAGQTVQVRIAGPADPAASVVAIRPDRLFLAPPNTDAALRLCVSGTTFRGLHRDLRLAFGDGQTLMIAIDADMDIGELAIGQEVAIGLKPDAAVLISR